MKIEDITRRYKKKIECKTETMNDYTKGFKNLFSITKSSMVKCV